MPYGEKRVYSVNARKTKFQPHSLSSTVDLFDSIDRVIDCVFFFDVESLSLSLIKCLSQLISFDTIIFITFVTIERELFKNINYQ